MNRRTFFKFLTLSTAGILLNPEKLFAEESEPIIYKPDLHFRSLELRPKTEMIVIHHTEKIDKDTKVPVDEDTTAERVHKWHVENNGWAGIGYHYLIRKNGMIEQGRPLEMIGAHVYGYNKNTVGICLAGNYNKGVGYPTDEQMQSLKQLTAWLCRKYNIQKIVGHRDLLSDTTCPGDNLYSRLDEVRDYCK